VSDTEGEVYRQYRFSLPEGATDLLVVRHGESAPARADAPAPTVDGHSDPELAPEGREQAERLADRLAHEHIDAIYVTTLRRTAQTAAPLAARLGLDPRVEPGLRAVHLGDWEGGLYRKMVAERHPLVLQAWTEERWDIIPGAEPADRFAARTGAAIGRIAQAHPGQVVAAVTHGGVIGQILAIATRSSPFAFVASDNASISRLLVTDGRWIVRTFNDTAHLEAAA
jgi:probable phosphoglycerate mutase